MSFVNGIDEKCQRVGTAVLEVTEQMGSEIIGSLEGKGFIAS